MLLQIQIPTLTDAYLAIASWAYHRYAKEMKASNRKPTGVPGNRDPDSPCPAFEPRPRRLDDWADCDTDGHYLCSECCHKMTGHQAGEVEP
jgi:hypothetical protein